MLQHHLAASAFFSLATIALLGCNSPPAAAPKPTTIEPGPYIVAEGDNLNSLAIRAYGDANLWSPLLNANRQLATRPRFRLDVGETINVPARKNLDRSLAKPNYPSTLPADYIIMPGDSLLSIAEGCYGNQSPWLQIYEANRSLLSERVKKNPKLLIAGEVLSIPKLDRGSQNTPGGE